MSKRKCAGCGHKKKHCKCLVNTYRGDGWSIEQYGGAFDDGIVYVTPYRSPASEIIPHLFVGNIDNCREFKGVAINVTEGAECENSHCRHCQVVGLSDSPTFANPDQLNRVASYVIPILQEGKTDVLLHCWVGMERSPLTASWVVSKFLGISLDDAWKIVSEKREIAADRRHWLVEREAYGHKGVGGYSFGGFTLIDGTWVKDSDDE